MEIRTRQKAKRIIPAAGKEVEFAMEFFEIYDQNYGRVRKFILALIRDEWTADDLTQETFIRVRSNLDALKDTSKLVPWIFSIARNLCLDHFRSLKKISLNECGIENAKDAFRESIVQKKLEQHEMSLCVQGVVRLLPEPYQSVITLFDVAELSHREIAEVLGTTVENIKVRLHRGRKKLKELFKQQCTFEVDERNVLVCEPVDRGKQ